jgi:hypothetical protein
VDNLHVTHTGATNYSLYVQNVSSDVTWNGRVTNLTDASFCIVNAGTVRNIIAKGSTCLYGFGANGGTFDNCTTFGINSGSALRMTTGGYVNGCIINSSNTYYGVAIDYGTILNNNTIIYKGTYRGVILGGTAELNNSTVICTTGVGVLLVDTSKMSLSNVKASTNVAVYNSSSNIDAVDRCVLEGLTTGAIESNGYISRNSTFISRLAPTLNNYYPPLMYNCDIICDWNNAGGHAVAETANGLTLVDCRLKVRHTSAVGLYTAGPNASTGDYYFSGLTMIGSSNLKSADIANLVTNTPDAQGNLILI